jgi:hypothetical protein
LVNRTFLYGLVSAAVGVAAGLGYQQLLAGTESWLAFLNVFAAVTLVLCLVFALVGLLRTGEDGIVGVGDALVVIGALVALVEVVVFAASGAWLGIAYGVIVVALAMFAIHQERQASMATAWVMAVCATSWVLSDAEALLLGLAPAALWGLAGAAYAMSLRAGEAV